MTDLQQLRAIIREEVRQALQDTLPQLLTQLLSQEPTVVDAPPQEQPAQPDLPPEVQELIQQREELLAELEALERSVLPPTPADEVDRLLNAFADGVEAQPEPEPVIDPPPTYSSNHPYFLGMDIYEGSLSLCLADTDTGRTYPLQFVTPDGKGLRSYQRQLQGEWQWETHLASRLSQTSQNQLEDRLHSWWQGLLGELRHPNLPVHDLPTIFQSLQGIIVSQPYHASELYGVRCRQTLLEVGWITAPELVLVIDRALAPLLAIKHRSPDPHLSHVYLLVSDHEIALGLLTTPPQTVHLDYGLAQLKAQASRMLFSQVEDADTAQYFYHTCQQAFTTDSTLHQWEYEWQHQSALIWRKDWETAQQQALRQWVEPLSQHLNQFLSHVPDPTNLDLWLVGVIPPLLKEWLCGKLIPAHMHQLPETAIAEGLAVAPFYREYLDIARLQYSDYFLLHELCNLRLPDPCDPELVLHTLHNRGVNVRACGDRLQRILFQGIPPNLGLANDLDKGTALFQETADGKLSACRDVMVILRSHLQQLQYGLRQNLAEPLVFPHYR